LSFEYADSRVPVAVWVYEGGLATRYFIGAHQVGSIRAVFDQAGAVVKTIDYDSFGNVLAETNPGLELPLGFACGLTDPDTQFVRFGVRDYDPEVGRWTAREPILFGDGLDAYSYCGGNPLAWLDPSGLMTETERKEVEEHLEFVNEMLHSLTYLEPLDRETTVLGKTTPLPFGKSKIWISPDIKNPYIRDAVERHEAIHRCQWKKMYEERWRQGFLKGMRARHWYTARVVDIGLNRYYEIEAYTDTKRYYEEILEQEADE